MTFPGRETELRAVTGFSDENQQLDDPLVTREKFDRIPGWKRAFDLTFVIFTFPIWLVVMVLVTAWIKLVSPGPTFYRQERIGYGGKKFMILKFRSMKVNVETRSHEQYFAELIEGNRPMCKLDAAGDPRLVLGARILRALGLDELPQLLNVFFGEMTLVGPRPCTPHEFEHYQQWQRERVYAPPGLTGLWQVSGKNSTTFTEMIALDVFYADNMSLLLDLEIILRTGTVLISQVVETLTKNRAKESVSSGALGELRKLTGSGRGFAKT